MTDDRDQANDRDGDAGGDQAPGRSRPAVSQHLDLDTISAYLDGQLEAAERTAAAAHLATCGDCRRELAELRATVTLLRGLPQFAPRRSFRLGPEHAPAAPRPGGWFARLLPALPALRAATVGVAVLLIAVTAGDLVSNRRSEQRPQPTAAALLTAREADEAAGVVGTESAAASSKTMEDGAGGFAEPQAPQPEADAAPEAAGEAAEPPADQAERGAVADEARERDGVAVAEPTVAANAGVPAAPAAAPAATPEAAPTIVTRGPARPEAGSDGAAERTRPSGWRLAQLALGLVLLWLIVSLVGVERLRRRA